MKQTRIQIRLIDIILNLSEVDFYKLPLFINDFCYSFFDSNRNYWEFEQWAKIKLGLIEDKKVNTISFFPLDEEEKMYEFDEKIINNYASLLEIFISTNTFVDLYCHISNETNKNDFMEFISYLIKNKAKKEQFKKCMNKLKKLNFVEIIYNFMGSLDGIYTITDNIGYSDGFFSDGEKTWINKVGNIYEFDVRDANYIIKYCRGNSKSNNTEVYLNHFEFDLKTLPDRNNLNSSRPRHPEIDFKQIDEKNNAVELIHDFNICNKQLRELLDSLNYLVKIINNEELIQKLSILKNMLLNLSDLKAFLILEYDKQAIVDSKELEKLLMMKYIDNK